MLGSSISVRQQPGGQRGRGRFPVGPRNHDRARPPQKLLPNRLRKRHVADLSIEHFFDLGVAARDRVAHHDKIDVGNDVFSAVAAERRESLRRRGSRSSAGRRPDPSLARPSPSRFSMAASVAIAVPQMPMRWTRVTERRPPQSQVVAGFLQSRDSQRQTATSSWDRWCAPRGIRERRGRESRQNASPHPHAVGPPSGSSQLFSSPMTTALARLRTAAC